MANLDWGNSYRTTQRNTAAALRQARADGRVRYQFGDGGPSTLGVVDPSRLSDRRIDELALRHAERVVQRAINSHNEQAERGAR